MLDKIGDTNTKLRESTEDAALAMAQHPAIGVPFWIQNITRGQVKKSAKSSVKHIVGKLNLMNKLISTFKVKEGKINHEACIEYALSNL
jgi:hypothetical protein